METITVVKRQGPHNKSGQSTLAAVYADRNEERIEGILNADVHIKGQADILIRQLFSPLCSAAVVIRRRDGSYLDPCDFGSIPRRNRSQGTRR